MSKRRDEAAAELSVPAVPAGISVAGHPRSVSAVRHAKGAGGLLGTLLAGIIALKAGLPLFDVMLRGLAAGIAGYLVLWAVAVAVARQLVIAEVRARYAELARAAAVAAADDTA